MAREPGTDEPLESPDPPRSDAADRATPGTPRDAGTEGPGRPTRATGHVRPADPAGTTAAALSLEGLGIAGLSRRRTALLAGTFATIWVVAVFARQVGDASAAVRAADALRVGNDALEVEVVALEAELARIQEIPYVVQAARAFDLGAANERPFVLAPGAPELTPDAPGTAGHRLVAEPRPSSPLEAWLTALFGEPPH